MLLPWVSFDWHSCMLCKWLQKNTLAETTALERAKRVFVKKISIGVLDALLLYWICLVRMSCRFTQFAHKRCRIQTSLSTSPMTIRMVVLKRRHLNWTRLIWYWLSQKFVGDLQKFATGPQDGDEEAIQIENTFYEVPQLPELLGSFQIFSTFFSQSFQLSFNGLHVLQSLAVS